VTQLLEQVTQALQAELEALLSQRRVRLVGLIALDGQDDAAVLERLQLACGTVHRPVLAVFETTETA
jgi:hypothetical protein